MATETTQLTDTWTEIGTSLETALLQTSGAVRIHISDIAPGASSAGFLFSSGTPVGFYGLAALGGGLWARADSYSAALTHAVA